jgi:hypothetical protein
MKLITIETIGGRSMTINPQYVMFVNTAGNGSMIRLTEGVTVQSSVPADQIHDLIQEALNS